MYLPATVFITNGILKQIARVYIDSSPEQSAALNANHSSYDVFMFKAYLTSVVDSDSPQGRCGQTPLVQFSETFESLFICLSGAFLSVQTPFGRFLCRLYLRIYRCA